METKCPWMDECDMCVYIQENIIQPWKEENTAILISLMDLEDMILDKAN